MDRRTIFSLVSGASVLALYLFLHAERLAWISESDWSVIGVLALFLISTEGLKESGYLEWSVRFIADREMAEHALFAALIAASGVLAAIVTNDVSLFAVAPLTLGVCRRRGLSPTNLIVLETMAANVGSSTMPWGNPQNIFLFHHFGIAAVPFYRLMIPPSVVLLALLCAAGWKLAGTGRKNPPENRPAPARHPSGLVFAVLLAASSAFVLRLVPVSGPALVGIAVAAAAIANRRTLLRADWTLLGLFAVVFLAVDALQASPAVGLVHRALGGGNWIHVFVASAGISQIISNVPAALIAAGALRSLPPSGPLLHGIGLVLAALLLGVNVGGLGTPVASLANLIALRLFVRGGGSAGEFYRPYWRLNLIGLAVYLPTGLLALLAWRG